jgi:hypothetical protein
LRQGWGLIGAVFKKASFSMVEKGLVKKVSFSCLEMSVVKKFISAWLDWSKQIKIKVQKAVKKLSKSCQKVVKDFVKPRKKKKENKFFHDFGKLSMILKIGCDFENLSLF